MGLVLILLSICTYPAFIYVAPEVRFAFGGTVIPDIFQYYRAELICFSAIILAFFIRKIYWPFVVLGLLIIVSLLFSKHPNTAAFGMPGYYEGSAVLISYLVFASRSKFPEKAVEISVYIIATLGLLQLAYGTYLLAPVINWLMPSGVEFSVTPLPIYSSLGNPNHLGLFCALLFPYFLVRKKWIVASILATLLIGSNSRGAWLSIAITTFIIYKKHWKMFLVGMVAILILLRAQIFDGHHFPHCPLRDGDLNGRAFIWKKTIPMLKNHWVFGSGPGVYVIDFPQHTQELKATFGGYAVVDRPHNMILNTWYSTGFLSVLIWALILFDFYVKDPTKPIKMGVLGFLIAGVFTDSVVSVTPFFMVMLGAGL